MLKWEAYFLIYTASTLGILLMSLLENFSVSSLSLTEQKMVRLIMNLQILLIKSKCNNLMESSKGKRK